eukprot:CAMPEP_0202960590 /NCGR_PEP_ID=MMETSP1396-20130829/4734_1 /ASSEMBLY_ACC=CAM_ASM_000872 /TAXON_ID= /ORGANISM="Pseudokeronopsis sp., Strain Brazil" /LENGTH=300 /DNA_ID=CAMNT_0049679897 /DNA_START=551 /DNA_END=1453 /DNA_ORIENTATION=+
MWGSLILGERYGKAKQREIDANDLRARERSMNFGSKEFEKVMKHVNRDYHQAFKEWLVHTTDEFRPWSPTYIVYGTLVLWVAWLFFNAGSQSNMFAPRTNGPAKIIINTWLSGSVAGIVAVYTKSHVMKTYSFVNRFDCTTLCNAVLCGLVGVSGCCDQVEPYYAVTIGFIATFFYIGGCMVMDKLHIDDAVESTPIHLWGGLWGTIATGIFSNKYGLVSDYPDSWNFLGWQCIGLVAMFAWSSAFAIVFFFTMKKLNLLRIAKEIEIVGLDIAELGGLTEEVYQKVKVEYGRNMSFSPD